VTALAPVLQAFFTDRLARQRHASPQTVAAYRDTWRLLLAFAAARTGKQPSKLDIADLDAPLIGDFLDHLERDPGNSPRTRNARLAAIHSMFSYAALRHPEHAEAIARVLAIPAKRFDRALVTWLTEPEVEPCSPPRTRPPGPGGATTPCSPSPPRPGCGSPSRPGSPAGTSTSAPGRTSPVTARDARRGSPRSPSPSSPSCAPGSPKSTAHQVSRCSRTPPAGSSAATPSRNASPSTSRPRPANAPP
jgi:hypothetical protein